MRFGALRMRKSSVSQDGGMKTRYFGGLAQVGGTFSVVLGGASARELHQRLGLAGGIWPQRLWRAPVIEHGHLLGAGDGAMRRAGLLRVVLSAKIIQRILQQGCAGIAALL